MVNVQKAQRDQLIAARDELHEADNMLENLAKDLGREVLEEEAVLAGLDVMISGPLGPLYRPALPQGS